MCCVACTADDSVFYLFNGFRLELSEAITRVQNGRVEDLCCAANDVRAVSMLMRELVDYTPASEPLESHSATFWRPRSAPHHCQFCDNAVFASTEDFLAHCSTFSHCQNAHLGAWRMYDRTGMPCVVPDAYVDPRLARGARDVPLPAMCERVHAFQNCVLAKLRTVPDKNSAAVQLFLREMARHPDAPGFFPHDFDTVIGALLICVEASFVREGLWPGASNYVMRALLYALRL